MTTDLYLHFPDLEAALAVATAIIRASDPSLPADWVATSLPTDGVVGPNRYDIIEAIPPSQPTGATDPETGEPIMEPQPGVWLLGRWRGPDPVPAELTPFMSGPWGHVIG